MNFRTLFSGSRKTAMNNELDSFFTGKIHCWKEIYNGGGDWRYTTRGGLKGGMRRVASLGAAKALCAELSRLCFSEGTDIICSDRDSEKYLRQVLEENNFFEKFSAFLEQMFALGGGAVKIFGDSSLDFVPADRFIPTKWNGTISGGAFGSAVSVGGKNYILAESRELTSDGLLTENRLFTAEGKEANLSEVFPELLPRSRVSGIDNPLFVYFRAGAPQGNLPLGISVFEGAEDTLKALDIVFDSLMREFILGKKRIIVPYYAVRGEYDENGDIQRYFDVNDEVFEAFSTSDSEELKISDNTSQLRVSEHTAAIGELLDLLCMQTGLSERALSFKNGTIRTATEVISRSSRTYRTACTYRRMISENLKALFGDILKLGKTAGKLPAYASEKVEIRFADGICEDENARADRAFKLYSGGLISRSRAISEIYGISKEQADAIEKEDFNERE